MKTLEEVLDNLKDAVKRYEDVPLFKVKELSEILRTLGVNISYLVQLRDYYYRDFQNSYQNSDEKTNAQKIKEAESDVPELDLIRKVLQHYAELQKDIRTQISLHKN